MTILSLKEKFDEATSILRDKASPDKVTILIHRTSWLRILLEHDEQEGDAFFLEVEISLPDDVGSKGSDSSELIDQLSEHLQYLRKLREVGFELSIIGAGCIYCASKELHETPRDNIFRALIPP